MESEQFEEKLDIKFSKLAIFFNNYLGKDNNYLILVSSANHGGSQVLFKVYLIFAKYISEKIDKTVKYNDVDEILKLVFSLGNYSVNAPLAYHRNLLTANNITDFFEETKLLKIKIKLRKKVLMVVTYQTNIDN